MKWTHVISQMERPIRLLFKHTAGKTHSEEGAGQGLFYGSEEDKGIVRRKGGLWFCWEIGNLRKVRQNEVCGLCFGDEYS